ncbi:MAG: hypothetical protein R3B70_41275 [Polyangiaceae bacterium]
MFLVAWVLLGLVAGALLRWALFRGDLAHAADMLLGAFGGLVGGFVFNVAVAQDPLKFHSLSLFAAVVGAFGMLAGFHALRRRGHG